jgi:protein AATF/BFR2
MRPDDLAQLKKFKQRKQTVDRKASKGRKIRYVLHNKIQNFMFPIPAVAPNLQQVDSEKLFQSLFQ